MTVHILANNLTRGEISPRAYSRVDSELYSAAAERVSNFICYPEGGANRRPGTRFAGRAKNSTAVAFLEFSYLSNGQAYIIEAGEYYFRFWASGGRLTSSGAPVEVVTPYAAADIPDLQYVQVGDVIYIAHQSYAPRALTRQSHTSWSLDTISFTDGPYLPINDTAVTVYSSGDLIIGNTTLLTFSSPAAINGSAGLSSSDVGRLVRVKASGGNSLWTSGVITSVPTSTTANVLWLRVGAGTATGDDKTSGGTLGVGAPTKSWRLGAFGATPGYPKCVSLFESRLVWANTPEEPRTLYFSRSGLPLDYAPSHGDATVVSDHGFYPAILTGKADEILWLREALRLQIGTASGIRTLGGSDTTQAISPSNISQRLEVSAGCADVVPETAQTSTLFVGRGGKVLHHAYYSYETNSLVAPPLSTLSYHLFTAGIKKVAYQGFPEGVLWVLGEDGSLRGVTYDKDSRVVGSHRHSIGNNATIIDFTVAPTGSDTSDTRDTLWLLVQRTIDGSPAYYIEFLEAPFEDQDQEDAFFVDCGTVYDDTPTNTVSGLSYLEGETVAVLADGAVMAQQTVTGGEITLPNNKTASKIIVGLPITSEILTLRPSYQQADGFALTRRQRVVDVRVDVIRSAGVYIGPASGLYMEHLTKRQVSTPFGSPPELVSGTVQGVFQDSWDNSGQVYIKVSDPVPCYIRSLVIALDTERANRNDV